MPYTALWKGIHPRHPRFCRDVRIWWRYACWWAASNLVQLPGAAPRGLMRLAGCFDRRRVTLIHNGPATSLRFEPSGRWRAGEGRFYQFWFGPLSAAVRRIAKPFSAARGANVHRCDFTDRETGLLYGGDGAAMTGLFDKFVAAIGPTPEQEAAIAFAVDDLQRALHGRGGDAGTIN